MQQQSTPPCSTDIPAEPAAGPTNATDLSVQLSSWCSGYDPTESAEGSAAYQVDATIYSAGEISAIDWVNTPFTGAIGPTAGDPTDMDARSAVGIRGSAPTDAMRLSAEERTGTLSAADTKTSR